MGQIARTVPTPVALELARAKLRGSFEDVFELVGLRGLDVMLAFERRRIMDRYRARISGEGFVG